MQNLKLIIALAGLIAGVSACQMDGHHGSRYVVISEDNGSNKLKIEYSGKAQFNNDGTAIASITPNGYVKYIKNNRELIANSDADGLITYEVDHGNKRKTLDTADRLFLAQAVQDMIKHGHYNNGK